MHKTEINIIYLKIIQSTSNVIQTVVGAVYIQPVIIRLAWTVIRKKNRNKCEQHEIYKSKKTPDDKAKN